MTELIQEIIPGTENHCSECDTDTIESLIKCDDCSTIACSDCMIPVRNYHVCQSCRDENYFYCEECENIYHNDDIHCVDDKCLCDNCHDRLCTTCDSCDTSIYRSVAVSDNNSTYCERCAENMSRCESCDCLSEDVSFCEGCENYFCSDCISEHESGCVEREIDLDDHARSLRVNGNSAVTDYHPNVNWEFIKELTDNKTDPYFGIELEIEGVTEGFNSSLNPAAQLVGDKLRGKCICSHDGSLTNGFEIVFTPHKRKAFRAINMHEILKDISKTGCTSFQKGTCGLHIHIERTNFLRSVTTYNGLTYSMAELYQMFFNLLKYDIKRFSCRRQEHIDHYCKFIGSHHERYCAVNLSNSETIEIRIWRGTLDHTRFRANILFTLAVVDFMKAHSKSLILSNNTQRLKNAFKNWLLTAKEYQSIIPYFEKRHLFGF